MDKGTVEIHPTGTTTLNLVQEYEDKRGDSGGGGGAGALSSKGGKGASRGARGMGKSGFLLKRPGKF